MGVVVIKLKHLIIAMLILIALPLVFISAPKAVSVFRVNGREIPIYSVERADNKIDHIRLRLERR